MLRPEWEPAGEVLASLVEWGVPVRLEELSNEELAGYLAGHPDAGSVPFGEVDPPVAWQVLGTVSGLCRPPGVESAAALEELFALVDGVEAGTCPEATGQVTADHLLGMVNAAHRAVGYYTTLRDRAAMLLAEEWTVYPGRGQRPSQGCDERARRLRSVQRNALSRWQRGLNHPPGARLTVGEPSDPDWPQFGSDEIAAQAAELGRAFAVAEVSLSCGVSRQLAGKWLRSGQTLAEPDRLPLTAAAAQAGRLDPWKVAEILRATAALSTIHAEAVEGLVVPRAMLGEPTAPDPCQPGALEDVQLRTIPALREALQAAILQVDPDGARQRAAMARHTRTVVFRRLNEVMGEMVATLPMEHLTRVHACLDAAAARARTTPDPRTPNELRADILVELILTGAVPGLGDWFTRHFEHRTEDDHQTEDDADRQKPPPGIIDIEPGQRVDPATGEVLEDPAQGDVDRARSPREREPRCAPPARRRHRGRGRGSGRGPSRSQGGLPMQVIVTATLETLLGLTDDPGYLNNFGPISAEQVRDMVHDLRHDAVWRCAAVDSTHNTLLGMGRTTYRPQYRPGAELQRLTNSLYHDECAFPGCTTRATYCDFDHILPWPHGATCSCNGIPLCRRCHRLKTTQLINVEVSDDPQHPPGSLIWTTASGGSYLHHPPALVPTTIGQTIDALTDDAPPY